MPEMISLGTLLKTKDLSFCHKISQAIANKRPKDLNWTLYIAKLQIFDPDWHEDVLMVCNKYEFVEFIFSKYWMPIIYNTHQGKHKDKHEEIMGANGIISDYKKGLTDSSEFIANMLNGLDICGLVTKQEFIEEWNSMLQIPEDSLLKDEKLETIQDQIVRMDDEQFLGSDTNPLHQEYLANLFGDNYKETEFCTKEKQTIKHASLCTKPLFRSYDIGVSSTVLKKRNNDFEEKAKELFSELKDSYSSSMHCQ